MSWDGHHEALCEAFVASAYRMRGLAIEQFAHRLDFEQAGELLASLHGAWVMMQDSPPWVVARLRREHGASPFLLGVRSQN